MTEGLRAVAIFEALKGTLAVLAACGVLALIPRDMRHIAVELVGRLHLNPGKSYPDVFNRLMENTTNAQLWLIAVLVVVYAAVRLAEAYGLWHSRAWAEWLAAASGAIYVPVELYELWLGVSWIKLGALAVNIAIVVFMILALRQRRRPPTETSHV